MESFWAFSGSFNAKLSKTSKLSYSNTTRISADYPGDEEMRMLMITNFGYVIINLARLPTSIFFDNDFALAKNFGLFLQYQLF